MTGYSVYPAHTALQRYIRLYFAVSREKRDMIKPLFSSKHSAVFLFNFDADQAVICAVVTEVGMNYILQKQKTPLLNEDFLFDKMPFAEDFDALKMQLETVNVGFDAQKLVESYLNTYFNDINEPFSVKNISHVADYIERQKGLVTIKQLEEKFHRSRRWLEKLFGEQIRMSPKDFVRMTRFNALLTHVMTSHSFVSWSEMIDRYGYYDQSHLIRDFYDFTGQSPSQFCKNAFSVLNG